MNTEARDGFRQSLVALQEIYRLEQCSLGHVAGIPNIAKVLSAIGEIDGKARCAQCEGCSLADVEFRFR